MQNIYDMPKIELDITCPLLDEKLDVNTTLENGEEASWHADEVTGLVENLIRPACHMLKQMDGVGFYNDNGFKKEDYAPPPTPTPEEVFW
jgi:hypothetical protein